MAIKRDQVNDNKAKSSCLAILLILSLLLILGVTFFVKKKQVAKESTLTKQRVSLAINSEENQPIITIVITAVGSLKIDNFIDLQKEITIGIPSYLSVKSNELLGYNVALNIPLESQNNFEDNLESKTLFLKDSDNEVNTKLNINLNDNFNYQAVYTDCDEIYTASYPKAESFLRQLQSKNLIYLSGITNDDAIVYEVANKINYLILKNDLVIDKEISSEYIINKLLELEEKAKQNGSAIAIGSAYPLTIRLIKEWALTLSNKNIKLVSIKDFYKFYANRQ